MDVRFTKSTGGALVPAGEDEVEKMRRVPAGSVVNANISVMRNGVLFRKWWVLAQFAFDVWSETVPQLEYKGQSVKPDFQRFRRDLIILTGRFTPVWNALGELRVEAKSISWASMGEEEFQAMYSDTINVILGKILSGSNLTEERIRAHVDTVLAFD